MRCGADDFDNHDDKDNAGIADVVVVYVFVVVFVVGVVVAAGVVVVVVGGGGGGLLVVFVVVVVGGGGGGLLVVFVVVVVVTDDVVVPLFRLFELSCNLWDAVPPQQRPYQPHVSVSKVAESSTFSIAELSNLLQAVLPLALVAPVHLYVPWLLGMFLSENVLKLMNSGQ